MYLRFARLGFVKKTFDNLVSRHFSDIAHIGKR